MNCWNTLDELNFQLNGGWTGLIITLIAGLVKWAAIAALFALAWRVIV